MKKLFLTSGLVLCMAGQAYASTPITYDNNAYGPSGCNYTYLDTYDTSSSLEAIWESNPYTITLNSHNESNEYGSTAASPTRLYALYGDAVYLEEAHTNAMSTTANGLTAAPNGALPTGKTYTLTLNTNVTTSGTGGMNAAHTDSQVTAASGTKAASTNATMSFAGFFSATQSNKLQTNGTKYISGVSDTNPGTITTEGISAGTGTASASTWHAQYTCQNADTYTPQLTGYTFAGWYDAANNGNVVNDFCLDSNKTVYAHWTANHYDVIYAPGTHGTCGASCETTGTNAGKYVHTNGATYDSNYTAVAQNTTSITANTGYTFVGWNTQSGQTTANWTGVTPWTSTSPLTVYAAYTPKQYNVTYAVGTCGGSDKTYNNALTYDANYTVLGPGATGMTVTVPTGYTFNGWTESLAGNATRSEGDQYQPWQTDSNLTLTAQCSANSTKVAYNCGNSRATTPVAGTWTTPGTGTWTQVVASGGAWVASNNSGIYAQTATYDSAFTHPTGSSVCSLSGYTFNAWVCVTGTTSATTGGLSNDGLGTGADANKWKTNAAAVTCTATWTPNHITLNWNKNGADSADIAATACDYDGSITLPTAPTRNGYTFQGWTVSNGGN